MNDNLDYIISLKSKILDKKIIVNDLKTLLNGLKLVSDFLEKTILKPNNLNYPLSRQYFISSLK